MTMHSTQHTLSRTRCTVQQLGALTLLAVLTACGVGTTYIPDEETLAKFEAAGPLEPELDMSQMVAGVPQPGPYRVVPGDILQISGAGSFMTGGTGGPSGGGADSIEARVQPDGRISLPMLGDLSVMTPGDAGKLQGRTLVEIESLVADALSDRYLRHRPAIVVRVNEYQKTKVAVMGSVASPGVVELQSDQLSVFGALTAAGGLSQNNSMNNQLTQATRAVATQQVGAKMIRIKRPGDLAAKPILLPVKGYNLPMADVRLVGGETIEVEPWNPDLYVVLGLVGGRGVFPYPPGERYNLMQALAFASGTDPLVYPPYATIFRKGIDGKVIAVSFGINGEDIKQAMDVIIRPGDIIVVEHTIGSWTRQILWEALDIQVQFFINPFDSDSYR